MNNEINKVVGQDIRSLDASSIDIAFDRCALNGYKLGRLSGKERLIFDLTDVIVAEELGVMLDRQTRDFMLSFDVKTLDRMRVAINRQQPEFFEKVTFPALDLWRDQDAQLFPKEYDANKERFLKGLDSNNDSYKSSLQKTIF